MSGTPVRTATRIANALKKYQPVIESAKSRDVNESDTVTIVTDLLAEVFGFDKYSEITSELAIRGSHCDLAAKVDGKIKFLLEAKAAGTELKEQHTRQALDYAANEGVDWVILTNASVWKVYKVRFGKPVDQELLLEIDLTALESKNDSNINTLYLLSKEGFNKSALDDFSLEREALSRFTVGALLLAEPVLQVLRRELKRISPGVKIEIEKIENVVREEVVKRDVLEGDQAEGARRRVNRALARTSKNRSDTSEEVAEQPSPNAENQAATSKAVATGAGQE